MWAIVSLFLALSSEEGCERSHNTDDSNARAGANWGTDEGAPPEITIT